MVCDLQVYFATWWLTLSQWSWGLFDLMSNRLLKYAHRNDALCSMIISHMSGPEFCFRFNYTYYDKKHGAIHKSIEALDRMGMDIIETGDPDAFKKYLSQYDNTICGRHPISVFMHVSALTYTFLLHKCILFICLLDGSHLLTRDCFFQMLRNCTTKIKIRFLRYEQSSQCRTMRDSSVSYASAAAKVDAWRCMVYYDDLINGIIYHLICKKFSW